MSAGLQCCRLFSSAGPSSTRVQQPDQGTARASGQEGGGPAGRKESWAVAAAPPVGLSAPPTPSEAEPAPARRSSRRRRGRSRLQEPLETESPAAAVAAGAAHRQASEHRAAGADSFHHLKPSDGGPHRVLLMLGVVGKMLLP
ncbi:guanine nucleotide-binding protein G(I)/G(S)/G(O) subunit gamma-12 isoform X1 [Bubalus bubalis]|uniref:guanine nucleotide-binding protein G(I)/G(S)/G(O) subunit gamma-12 isoform X1 n=1 Tax=Bubalus bubalis TaxID=89462 RepID=UPI001D126F68|nr:guanine nucleotide-binding protein G(I)/G(S)/G(O) subunit gamma-12 isoform X1 [Bubalus bubalis]